MKPSVERIRGNLYLIVAGLALFSLAALTQAHAARKAHSARSNQPDLSLGGGLTVVAQTPPIQIGGEYHIRATASLQIAAADVGVFCFVTTTNHGFAQDHLLSDWAAAGELEQATISESWQVGDGEAIQLVCYSGDSDSLVRNASLTAVPIRSSRNSARTSTAYSNHARAAN
jgi:hypothetical protein